MTFIYDELSVNYDYKERLGLFKTKLDTISEIAPRENFVYHNIIDTGAIKPITKDTVIVYYCGAFTYFHSGHFKLMSRAYYDLKAIHDDVRVVISPANSDYIAEKYGTSVGVSNKQRYDRIIDYLAKSTYDEFAKSIMIDLNPMLNMVCDFNFTDLVKNFVEKYVPYNEIKTPYILCGKDRKYFKELENHTDKLKVYYDELAYYSWVRCNADDIDIERNENVEELNTKNRHKYFGQNFNPTFIRNPSRFFIFEYKKVSKNDNC